MAYASRQELVEWMQLPADAQLQPSELHARSEILDRALATADDLIDAFCRRTFTYTDSAVPRRFYPAFRSQSFDIGDAGPVTAVWDDGAELELGTAYNVVPYTFNRPASRLVRTDPWVWEGPVDVTAFWGWPSVPAAIKQACLKIAQKVYLSSRATAGVIVVQDTTVDIKMFDADAYKLLNPYRVAL